MSYPKAQTDAVNGCGVDAALESALAAAGGAAADWYLRWMVTAEVPQLAGRLDLGWPAPGRI
jgi:hypothetical protein